MLKKTLIFLFCLELISLLILSLMRLYNFSYSKILNKEPIVVYFSKKHLPHPIFRKRLSENNLEGNDIYKFDPNTVMYNHKLDRFGNEKKMNFENKKIDDFNIFLIGGSTVEGDGVYKSEDTIDSTIRKNIRDLSCFNTIRIYNEGVSGYSSKQDYLNISLRILPHYKPDMVISLQGWNDFLSYVGTRDNNISSLAKYWTTREQKIYKIVTTNKISNPIFSFIENNSYLGILLSSMFSTYQNYYFLNKHYKSELAKSENLEILSKNYFYFQDQSQKVLRLNGVSYFHFLQPILNYKKFPTKYEKNILNGKKDIKSKDNVDNSVYSTKFWQNQESFYNSITNDKRFIEKDWKYDFSRIFENSTDIDFADHGHLTKIAQKKVGKLIFDKVKKEIKCIK